MFKELKPWPFIKAIPRSTVRERFNIKHIVEWMFSRINEGILETLKREKR